MIHTTDCRVRYVPNTFRYLRFPSIGTNFTQYKRDLLRCIWYDSFYSSDYELAIKVLHHMSYFEYVDTDDISRLIIILEGLAPLRRQALTIELLDLLITDPNRHNMSKVFHQHMNEVLISMFLESAIRNQDVQIAKNILYRRVSENPHIISPYLKASLGVVLCIEAIQLSQSSDPHSFPAIEEISLNPLLIYYIFKRLFSKRNMRIETHRNLLFGLREHLYLAYNSNKTSTDVVALYVSFLEATRRKAEVKCKCQFFSADCFCDRR